MIVIVLGNLGSSKTLCTVKYMADNPHMKFYSNIHTTLPNQIDLTHDMIIKNEIVDTKKNRKTGDETPIYKKTLNVDFWKNINEPISVVLDEAHSIINSRSAMTTQNKIVTEWISLLRRVLGNDSQHEGELILITQLPNRIDVIARDMATQIRFHICHWVRSCNSCGHAWREHSEIPERPKKCPSCLSPNLQKSEWFAELYHFRNMSDFELWNYLAKGTFYRHYRIFDVEKYFPLYNTLQWDSLFSEN